jgi:mannose-6-phosphate isomerase-like protein (cupin superfamily)
LVVTKPYTQQNTTASTFLREFNESTSSDEFVWHRDRKDRYVRIVEGEGWKFQYDNKLPFRVYKNEQMFIPAGQYHRLIQGRSKLIVEIREV